MCRSKDDGGRRCPSTADPQKIAARNARRRARRAELKKVMSDESRRAGEVSPKHGLAGGLATGGEGEVRSLVDGREHRAGTSPRVLTIGGRTLSTISTVTPPAERAEQLRALGKGTPILHELSADDADVFMAQVQKLKEGNKFHASVYVYPLEEYKDMRLFISEDGESGIALKSDGDIVSVFSSQQAKEPRSANSMIATMISLGGKKLDCFDTVLPHVYAQEGFVEVGRDSWNDEYKPDGWEYETYKNFNNGRPDVVYMEYRGNTNNLALAA